MRPNGRDGTIRSNRDFPILSPALPVMCFVGYTLISHTVHRCPRLAVRWIQPYRLPSSCMSGYNRQFMRRFSDPLPDRDPSHPPAALTNRQIGEWADQLARLLDACLVIPGTNVRIGLDPLIGLIPGIGDFLSNAVGSAILFLATKARVPRIVLFRMGLNVSMNMIIGAIPGIGDLFSMWFKSNIRNARLLHRHCQTGQDRLPLSDWLYVGAILTSLLLLMGALAGVTYWLVQYLVLTFFLASPA